MKRTLSIIAAIAISVLFIWLSLRGKNLGDIGQAIYHAQYRWIFAYIAIVSVIHFIRVLRWSVLLEPVVKTTYREVNMLGAVGFLLLMILPLRLGELGRPFLVAEHLKVARSASLASVVFERIVDGLLMAGQLVVLLWILGPRVDARNAAILRGGAAFVTLIFGGGLTLLIFAARLPAPAEALVRHTIGRIAPKLGERVISMLRAFTDGLRVLPSVGKAIEFFGLTIVYWGLGTWGLLVLARGFGFNDLPLMCGFTIVGLQVIGAMIPGGPGSAGTFQVFTQFGLALFVGHSTLIDARGAAYANVTWIIQFTQQVLFGLYFIVLGRIHPKTLLLGLWRGDPNPPDDSSQPPGARREAELA